MHCVCVRTSTEKVGILITVLQINVTTHAFVVTISKTRWQYDIIWCVIPGQHFHSGFECCSRQEELGAVLLLQRQSIFWQIVARWRLATHLTQLLCAS